MSGARFCFGSAGETLPRQLGERWRYFLRFSFNCTDLLQVMQAVHEVKLSPFRCGERPEDRMIEQFAVRTQIFFALPS